MTTFSSHASLASSKFLCALGALFLTACGGGGGGSGSGGGPVGGGPGPGGGGPGGGDPGDPGDPGANLLALQQGDFWTFMWSLEDKDSAQGSGTSYASDAGSYTLTLGTQTTIDGQEMFYLVVEGDHEGSADGIDIDLAPDFLYVGTDGERLLGSRDGHSIETVFDLGGTAWEGGGWFQAWEPTTQLVASSSHLGNDFVDVDAERAGISSSEGGCEYFPGIGTICTGDDEWTIRIHDYAKAGVGMVGYDYHVTYSSDGGGFFTSFTTDIDVGLVETSLVAVDGWTPPPPAWSLAQPMTAPRSGFGAVAQGGLMYVMGGYSGESGNATDSVDVYDPASDEWTSLAPMPFGPRGVCTAESLHGSIYVLCDGDPADLAGPQELYRFDPASGAWSELSAPSASLGGSQSAVLPGLLGGVVAFLRGDTDGVMLSFYEPTTDLWYYDVCAGTPGVTDCGFTGVGGDLFLLGGWQHDWFSWSNPWDETERVRIWNEQCWGSPPSLGDKRRGLVGVHLDGFVYAIGGEENTVEQRTVERMSSATLSGWEEIQGLLTPRRGHAAVALDGKLYVLGGRGSDGGLLSSVEVLDPLAL